MGSPTFVVSTPVTAVEPEKALLVGLVAHGTRRWEVDDHLGELERLVDTAGCVVVERLIQERRVPDPATMVGAGFVEKLAEHCMQHDVRVVVFDDDLAPSQVRNIERVLPKNVKVIDRAAVILDIFAQRARSSEAQTQVELAQLSYLLPRLTRRWRHLSRQAGGIGTRGVGETQLEIDRRLISKRIAQLKDKLALIERDRRQRRRRRQSLVRVAIVGYTNAGKSSLFRRLSHSEVLVEDRLFATLDPRTRRVSLGDEVIAVMTDTVGFIRKLPHDLVAPFRSTLEEATEADVVLHVVDVAHPSWRVHLEVGDEVLENLGIDRQRVVVALNKVDLLSDESRPHSGDDRPTELISVATGEGVAELCLLLRDKALAAEDIVLLRIPLDAAGEVEQALQLPYQVACRFSPSMVEVAVRTSRQRLSSAGLSRFLVNSWNDEDRSSSRVNNQEDKPDGVKGTGGEHADL